MAKKRKKADAPGICENCRWWEEIPDLYDLCSHKGSGWCRRYPPVPVAVPGVDPLDDVRFVLPETGVLSLCGEFEMMGEPRRTE